MLFLWTWYSKFIFILIHEGVQKNQLAAFNIFQALKSYEAYYWSGKCLFYGAGMCLNNFYIYLGIQKDKKRGLQMIEDASTNGNLEASVFLYFCYLNGKGLKLMLI